MVFLRRGITALLVFSLISLTSILTSEKVNAQEVAKTECPMAQFLTVGNKPCVKNQTPEQKLFPKEALVPTPELKKETKKENHNPQIAFVPKNPVPESNGSLSAEVLFNMINEHRAQINLPAYQNEDQVCSIAAGRRDEIVEEIFVTGQLHAGFWGDNHPFWATENMIWQHSEKLAMNWWLNSPIHRAAIEGDYLYACGTCNGEVCNMVFSSLTPKVTPVKQVAAALEPPQTDALQPTVQTPTPQVTFSKVLAAEKGKLTNTSSIIR